MTSPDRRTPDGAGERTSLLSNQGSTTHSYQAAGEDVPDRRTWVVNEGPRVVHNQRPMHIIEFGEIEGNRDEERTLRRQCLRQEMIRLGYIDPNGNPGCCGGRFRVWIKDPRILTTFALALAAFIAQAYLTVPLIYAQAAARNDHGPIVYPVIETVGFQMCFLVLIFGFLFGFGSKCGFLNCCSSRQESENV